MGSRFAYFPNEIKIKERGALPRFAFMETAIKFENVTKTFGTIVANKDINFDVKKGEILALLGENGSGKTTLCNMLAGIYYPDHGDIVINGEVAQIRSPFDAYKYHIGMYVLDTILLLIKLDHHYQHLYLFRK